MVNVNLRRSKLVVLDANFYWTEKLFSACNNFADVLLLRPRDFRGFKREHGRYFIDLQPKPLSKGVWEQRICCPPGWLFHYWPLTERLLASLIRRFQGEQPLIFVFSYPYYYSLASHLEAFSMYYNIDDYRDYWKGREDQTRAVEKLAVSRADLTLCVANYRVSYLRNVCPPKAASIVHLPHGCSPEFMVQQPFSELNPLPRELQTFSRPIAGYIGALNYRFDFGYLAKVAKQLPDVNFILGGDPPRQSDGKSEWWQGVKAVHDLPNVHLIGRVAHERVGECLQSFDVLLMPYAQCDFNVHACPMKLWDYMGTSLPIVANDVVPEVTLWSDLILISKEPDEFVSNIRFALVNRQWKSVERLEIAKAHTWQKQADKLYQVLREHVE